MRILLYGTSPLAGSGYATAVRYVSRGLLARGHAPAVFAWNSHVGGRLMADGVPLYPRGATGTGFEALSLYSEHHGAELILAICDPWVHGIDAWRFNHDRKVVFWYPCQSEPAPRSLVKLVEQADAALCYSEWGTATMQAAGSKLSRYVPLGVDPATFRPMERAECRAALARIAGADIGPETFVWGMVAANSSTIPVSRKAFDQALLAFARFRDQVPDSYFYLHAWPTSQMGGFDLPPLVAALGLTGRVLFPPLADYLMGFSDHTMAVLYNAFDVACQATAGEGFGLPILEAQSCGCPVITTDHSSMPELTRNGRAVQACGRIWAPHPMDGWMAVPDPEDIAQAALEIHDCGPPDREGGRELARELAWDRVIDEHLIPALEEIAA